MKLIVIGNGMVGQRLLEQLQALDAPVAERKRVQLRDLVSWTHEHLDRDDPAAQRAFALADHVAAEARYGTTN